jgi:hypothetical protein
MDWPESMWRPRTDIDCGFGGDDVIKTIFDRISNGLKEQNCCINKINEPL